ncbi:MAG: hypothetical protein WB992_19395 [Bryobacteraceae bacterium]
MNKLDLAARLARQTRHSCGKAADEVDLLVFNMLKDLKRPVRKATLRSAKAASKDKT